MFSEQIDLFNKHNVDVAVDGIALYTTTTVFSLRSASQKYLKSQGKCACEFFEINLLSIAPVK